MIATQIAIVSPTIRPQANKAGVSNAFVSQKVRINHKIVICLMKSVMLETSVF
ncbi:MAG: hypothetical protein Q8O99_08305 [bacterium]|nr:hypothetical protein [bacterium]